MKQMLKKAYRIFAVMAVFFCPVFFAACGSGEGDGLTVEDVSGVWVQSLSDGTKTMELKEDMTYSESIDITSGVPISTTNSDTYRLEGDKIIVNYSDYGMESEYTVEISGDTMKWDNGKAVLEFQRK